MNANIKKQRRIMEYQYALIYIFIAAFALPAYAAPNVSGVSGTMESGQSVTITGSSFGTKSTAAPIIWDNFENGTTGSSISNGWTLFDQSPGTTTPIYSNTQSHSGLSCRVHPTHTGSTNQDSAIRKSLGTWY